MAFKILEPKHSRFTKPVVSIKNTASAYISSEAMNLLGWKVGDRIEMAVDLEENKIALCKVEAGGVKLAGKSDKPENQGAGFSISRAKREGIKKGIYRLTTNELKSKKGTFYIFAQIGAAEDFF